MKKKVRKKVKFLAKWLAIGMVVVLISLAVPGFEVVAGIATGVFILVRWICQWFHEKWSLAEKRLQEYEKK